VFHAYKKGLQGQKPLLSKGVIKRVILPYGLVCLIAFMLKLFHHPTDLLPILKQTISAGGCTGPGSYYIWIYVEFALLLNALRPLFRRLSGVQLLCAFIAVSELLELICSWTQISQPLYRLMPFRYVFLIYLGYKWVTEGVVINRKTIILSLISLALILYLNTNVNLSPWVFETGWRSYHWFVYYYPAYLFVYILYVAYQWGSKTLSKMNRFMIEMGKASMEIYLIQMLVFAFWPLPRVSFTSNATLWIVNAVLPIILSIAPAMVWFRKSTKRAVTQIKTQ
jgi:peptidoglycan/LPS O-acetylase OafA/YrhL